MYKDDDERASEQEDKSTATSGSSHDPDEDLFPAVLDPIDETMRNLRSTNPENIYQLVGTRRGSNPCLVVEETSHVAGSASSTKLLILFPNPVVTPPEPPRALGTLRAANRTAPILPQFAAASATTVSPVPNQVGPYNLRPRKRPGTPMPR